jgi:hypothetical protein
MVASPSASFLCPKDSLQALCDSNEPSHSNDHSIPRFTFWDHRGTSEWVQYDFNGPQEVSSVEVYWFDDRPGGGCRTPQAWTLLYDSGYAWVPVKRNGPCGTARDQYNRLTFQPVRTTALRINVEQQPDWSSGVLEWKVNGRTPKLGKVGAVGHQERGHLDLDYTETWLALAASAEVGGSTDPKIAQALSDLQKTAGILSDARNATRQDFDPESPLAKAAKRMAELKSAYPVDGLLSRLYGLSPDRCLKLMVQLDWLHQDARGQKPADFLLLACRVIDEISPRNPPAGQADASTPKHPTRDGGPATNLLARRETLLEAAVSPAEPKWLELYLDACRQRRRERLASHLETLSRIVFTKHHDIGGQHYAYTEDISDSPYNDNNPFPSGGKLCLLEMDGLDGTVHTLIDEPDGLVRDPDVSHDGRRILFAWRKSMTGDDYHLYEMDVDDGRIRQLTFGAGVADYEGVYLPGGNLVFNSTRCQQIVDCWWADVSNLYTCDGQGRYLRRLGFDQVHTNYPQVMSDGRVVYTRWDYNDRGQIFPQPLFQMNPDGTAQREFYGNNSWFPTTILHARGIPGTGKVVCVLSGHHTYQKGKLAIIDPTQGRQENTGVQLIAPVRPTEAVRIDMYGHEGEQFQYPYPLSETEFLVTFSTEGSRQGRAPAEKPFGIYFMTIDGRRELLVADPAISCNQALPLAPRPEPRRRPTRTDYRADTGTYYLQDIYAGPGLDGVPRGTVKSLRVVGLEFRAAGIGSNSNRGPAGGALVSTPISINGSWDVKHVLGTARVYEDGSACFRVPARTPVYFQALDDKNQAVQTMRSWSTLQPGETFSCVGCHEPKNTSPPPAGAASLAMRAGPQDLDPFYGPPRGFSFAREIQPILDQRCVECHNRRKVQSGQSTISLEGTAELDSGSLKRWSDAYKALADPKLCSWVSPQSAPPMLEPCHAGAVNSKLMRLLEEGHEGVELAKEEWDKLACWIDLAVPFSGDYTEGMDPNQVPKYDRWLDRRRHWQAEETANIQSLLQSQAQNPSNFSITP